VIDPLNDTLFYVSLPVSITILCLLCFFAAKSSQPHVHPRILATALLSLICPRSSYWPPSYTSLFNSKSHANSPQCIKIPLKKLIKDVLDDTVEISVPEDTLGRIVAGNEIVLDLGLSLDEDVRAENGKELQMQMQMLRVEFTIGFSLRLSVVLWRIWLAFSQNLFRLRILKPSANRSAYVRVVSLPRVSPTRSRIKITADP